MLYEKKFTYSACFHIGGRICFGLDNAGKRLYTAGSH